MHISNKSRLILFILIIVGFYMIIRICLFTKQQSHSISTRHESGFYLNDSLKITSCENDALFRQNGFGIEFPNKGKAWKLKGIFIVTY